MKANWTREARRIVACLKMYWDDLVDGPAHPYWQDHWWARCEYVHREVADVVGAINRSIERRSKTFDALGVLAPTRQMWSDRVAMQRLVDQWLACGALVVATERSLKLEVYRLDDEMLDEWLVHQALLDPDDPS